MPESVAPPLTVKVIDGTGKKKVVRKASSLEDAGRMVKQILGQAV